MSKLKNDKISIELDLKAQRAQEEIHKLTKTTQELRKQNQEHRKEISRLAATEGDYSAEIKKLNEAIAENNKKIDSNKRAIEKEAKSLDISKLSVAQLKQELKSLEREFNNTSKATNPQRYRELEQAVTRYKDAIQAAKAPTDSFVDSLRKSLSLSKIAEGALYSIGATITNQVTSALKSIVTVITDFESANSRLAAVLGTNMDGIGKLTEQAKLLGRTTTATASQVTGLQVELAKLGFAQQDIERLTPATLKFAKAVGTDLSSAAAFAGSAMRIFGKDASQAEEVMATLAVSTTSSALDFSKLQASLATIGPVAASFGLGVEDTVALLGTLANAGFDASTAATATRNIILKLCDANGDLAQALGGPVKSLDDMVAGLVKLDAEGIDLAKTLELTDKRSVAAFSSLLKGGKSITELRDTVSNCTYQFRDMVSVMSDNSRGSWLQLQSAIEGVALKFYDFRQIISGIYKGATALVGWIGTVIDALSPFIESIKRCLAVIGSVVSAIGSFIGYLTDLAAKSDVVKRVLSTLATAVISYKSIVLVCSAANREFIKTVWAKIAALKSEGLSVESIKGTWAKLWTVLKSAKSAYAAVAIVVAGVITYLSELRSRTDAVTQSLKAQKAIDEKVTEGYADQKSKIDLLVMAARNESIALSERKKAVDKLNEIIPGYNAEIDATTGKYKASAQALETYLGLLEKKIRFEANKEHYSELIKKQEAARRALTEASDRMWREVEQNAAAADNAFNPLYGNNAAAHYTQTPLGQTHFKAEYEEAKRVAMQATKAVDDFAVELNESAKDAQLFTQTVAGTGSGDGSGAAGAVRNLTSDTGKAVSRLKELDAQIKALRKKNPQTDEEYRQIRQQIKALQEERKLLLGNKKIKRTPGTYKPDSLDAVTAKPDDEHQKHMLALNKRKSEMEDYDYAIAKNRELIRYSKDLIAALADLAKHIPASHKQTLDKITAAQNAAALQMESADYEINKATVQSQEAAYAKRIEAIKAYYAENKQILEQAVSEGKMTRGTADVYLLQQQRNFNQDMLVETQRYYDELAVGESSNHADVRKRMESLKIDIAGFRNGILSDTGKFMEKLRTITRDTTSRDGIAAEYIRAVEEAKSLYAALINSAGDDAEAISQLQSSQERKLAGLLYTYREQVWSQKEIAGLTWDDEYQRQLDKLDNFHQQGLISETEYQKAKLKLGMDHANKYFSYFSQLSTNAVGAIQEAEISMSAAKYDVLIQQAKNNGEDTAALEQEKENAKLEIQKKYADVDFAVKISTIIGNTAVSIMQAFAQLGPIGGAIAAVMLTAMGAAQVEAAKAERDKIKNMQPGRVASSTTPSPAKAERVLSGYAEGGYTGDGDRYEIAGVVHKGEYVVPKPIMDNPKVVDAVGTIEAIRRNRAPLNSGSSNDTPRGFADGGYTSSAQSAETKLLTDTLDELRKSIKNIRAHVVYKDITDTELVMQKYTNPFTRR